MPPVDAQLEGSLASTISRPLSVDPGPRTCTGRRPGDRRPHPPRVRPKLLATAPTWATGAAVDVWVRWADPAATATGRPRRFDSRAPPPADGREQLQRQRQAQPPHGQAIRNTVRTRLMPKSGQSWFMPNAAIGTIAALVRGANPIARNNHPIGLPGRRREISRPQGAKDTPTATLVARHDVRTSRPLNPSAPARTGLPASGISTWSPPTESQPRHRPVRDRPHRRCGACLARPCGARSPATTGICRRMPLTDDPGGAAVDTGPVTLGVESPGPRVSGCVGTARNRRTMRGRSMRGATGRATARLLDRSAATAPRIRSPPPSGLIAVMVAERRSGHLAGGIGRWNRTGVTQRASFGDPLSLGAAGQGRSQ